MVGRFRRNGLKGLLRVGNSTGIAGIGWGDGLCLTESMQYCQNNSRIFGRITQKEADKKCEQSEKSASEFRPDFQKRVEKGGR